MNRHTQIGVLVLSLSIVITGFIAGFQSIQVLNLSEQVVDLENQILDLQEYYQEIESNHSEIQELYSDLLSNSCLLQEQYCSLNTTYSELLEDYLSLELDYQNLSSHYAELFNDYENLRVAFEDSLTDPIVPTIDQVMDWLETDDTDQQDYVSGIWECGDYSAMLMTRAKLMNWRMRIAVVYFSLEGDPTYGSTSDVYGTYGHALNLIECTDGVYYIEPQSDGCWYFTSGPPTNHVHIEIHTYYDFTDDSYQSLWDGQKWWTNFYSYFG